MRDPLREYRSRRDIVEDGSFSPAERDYAERQMDQLRAEHPTLEALYEADVERERAE